MQKERNYRYDVIKVLSTFMVCFYHLKIIDMGHFSGEGFVPSVGRLLTNFCAMSVPLFFMVNGAIMLQKSLTVKKVFLRAVKIIFLYFFWMIIIDFATEAFFDHSVDMSVQAIFSRGKYTTHLWFLLTLAILTLSIPVVRWCNEKNKIIIWIAFILLLIYPFTYNYAIIFGNVWNISFLKGLSRTGVGTMYSFAYFWLGKVLAGVVDCAEKNRTKIKALSAICCISGWILVTAEGMFWTNWEGVVFDGVNSSFPTLGALLMAVGTFLMICMQKNVTNKHICRFLTFLSTNMLGIYIFHYVFTERIEQLVTSDVSVLWASLICVAIILITAAATAICKKIPLLKSLVVI